MTAPHADLIINGYLALLDAEARGLPEPDRSELLDDIREHISEARSQFTEETDANLLALLDRLGAPADVVTAAEPRGRASAPPLPPRHLLGASSLGLIVYGSLRLAVEVLLMTMHALGLPARAASWTPTESTEAVGDRRK